MGWLNRGERRTGGKARNRRKSKYPASALVETLEPRLLLDGNLLAVNDFPTALDEDSLAVVIDVMGNDTAEAGTIISAVTQGDYDGTVVITNDGADLTYQPAANFNGKETFAYTIRNLGGEESTAVVTVTVNSVNDPPQATDDVATIEDGAASLLIDALDNDSFAPDTGETLTITSVTQGTYGAVTISEDGLSLTYTPGDGYFAVGDDVFTYTIQDGKDGLTDTATVYVKLLTQAKDDAADAVENGGAVLIDVLANDIVGVAREPLTIINVTQGAGGDVAIVDDGFGGQILSYQPLADFFGEDHFTYTIQDTEGSTVKATVTVTVAPQNDDAPIVEQGIDSFEVDMNASDTVIDLYSHFYDADILYLYRFNSSLGSFDVRLFEQRTPITTANFRAYADAGDYADSFIHRSVDDFVIQGGGYQFSGAITSRGTILNEYAVSNVRGTIAMAKVGDDPDSATSQWFFNLADNSDNLDNTNGGYTVFGIVMGDGMDVIDAIAALKTFNKYGFPNLPLRNYVEGNVYRENMVIFDSVSRVHSDAYDDFTFQVVGNTNPGLVTTTIDADGELRLHYVTGQSGQAELTIRATDKAGAFVETTFSVDVNPLPDLTANVTQITLPTYPVGGARGAAVVVLGNQRAVWARGRVNIQIWASPDGNLTETEGQPEDDYLLTTLWNVPVNLWQGQTAEYTAAFNLPLAMANGQYKIVAVADSANTMAEYNEDNNTGVSQQEFGMYNPFVDLRGVIAQSDFQGGTYSTQRGYVSVTVTNYGNTAAVGRMNIEFWASGDGDISDGADDYPLTELANQRVNLAPGASATYTAKVQVGANIPQGYYYLVADIDSDNTIVETPNATPLDGEANNIAKRNRGFRMLNPDLVVSLTQLNLPTAPVAGVTRGTAVVTITNNSWIPAYGSKTIQLWASKDGTVGKEGDYLLAELPSRYLRMKPGSSISFKMSFVLPANIEKGEYEIYATLANPNVGVNLSDSNAGNNTVGSNTLHQVRDPFVDLVGQFKNIVVPNPATGGDRVSGTVQVTNQGNTAARGTMNVQIWGSSDGDISSGQDDFLLATLTNVRVSLSPDGQAFYRFSGVLPGNMPEQQYDLVAVIDAGNNIPEATPAGLADSEGNNEAFARNAFIVQNPDLTAAIGAVRLANPTLPGTRGSVQVNVVAAGGVRVNGRADIQIWASLDGVLDGDDTLLATLNQLIRLAPNGVGRYTVSFVLPAGMTPGDYRFIAVVDSSNDLAEGDETNNRAVSNRAYTVQEAFVDLRGQVVAGRMANPMTAGDAVQANVLVNNVGNVAANGRMDIQIWASADGDLAGGGDDYLIGTLQNVLVNLAPGRAATYRFVGALPGDVPVGLYDLVAVIDAGNAIPENAPAGQPNAEANNQVVLNDVLNVQTGDLTVQFTAVNLPQNVTRGTQGSVQVQVDNVGPVRTAGQMDIQVWATSDGVLDGAGDWLLTTLANQNIQLLPGRGQLFQADFALPGDIVNGNYQLLAVVDSSDNLRELNEANNTALAAPVHTVADPFVDLTVAVNWDALGGVILQGNRNYLVPVTITNTGNIATGPFRTTMYAELFDFGVPNDWENPVEALAENALAQSLWLPVLGAGETVTINMNVFFGMQPGLSNYKFNVLVDDSALVNEVNEGNNWGEMKVLFIV